MGAVFSSAVSWVTLFSVQTYIKYMIIKGLGEATIHVHESGQWISEFNQYYYLIYFYRGYH